MADNKAAPKTGSKPKIGAHTKLEAKALKCDCKLDTAASKFQDEKYGKGMRICNPSAKGWGCTVCSRILPY